MKIGFFTECYLPVMNGVSVSIDTFRKALEDKGHEVFIFAPDNKDEENDPHVFRFPAIKDKKKRLYPITFPSIEVMKTYLPEEVVSNLDIIHSQHMFTMGLLARYTARKYDKPLIYTYHTMLADYTHYAGVFALLLEHYLNNMTKRFCNTCDQIITPSNPMKKLLLKYGVKKPVEVIMTGIEPKNFKRYDSHKFRKKYKIDEEKKLLLYLSRIAKEKNLDFLLEAFVKIKREYPECHLVMVGGGPEEKWCKQRINELKIKDSVTMTGMLPKEEANEIFGMADLFVFPSISETQGIVIAEAMAAGTPPVAVGKMGPIDLVHDGEDGYLTKLDTDDFAEKVVKLLKNNHLRQEFAHRGLLRVDQFSNETSTSKLISLYEKVLRAKGSKTRADSKIAGEKAP